MAVYNPASGDTHLLDAVAQEILHILTDRPQSISEAASTLAAFLKQAVDPALEQRVAEAIAEFDRAGLVFPLEAAA